MYSEGEVSIESSCFLSLPSSLLPSLLPSPPSLPLPHSDEDDTAELLRELQKIRKERKEEQEKQVSLFVQRERELQSSRVDSHSHLIEE